MAGGVAQARAGEELSCRCVVSRAELGVSSPRGLPILTLDRNSTLPSGTSLGLHPSTAMSLTTYISPRHTTAYISVIVFIWVPVTAYCDYRSLFGNWPLVKLLVFAGAGGALSFVLFAEAKDRVLAMVGGCVAGIGAASAYIYFLAPLDRCVSSVSRPSSMLLVIGAVPGFLLMWLFKSRKPER